jgi:hypothetical protein
MSYVNRVGDDVISAEAIAANRGNEYHDRVRWGPIFSGVLVALATQFILSSLFGAIGAATIANSGAPRTVTSDVVGNVGWWSTIALLISLFIGGWTTSRACGPINRSTALLNGAILWATTLAISSLLLANGVWGAFGVAVPNTAIILNQFPQPGNTTPQSLTNLTAEQARILASMTSKALLLFVFGSLLGLIAAMMGTVVGSRSRRTNSY